MTARLPARLEAMGLIRAVQAAGGFGTVLHRGEVDAGALMIVLVEPGVPSRALERMPGIDGQRTWHCARSEEPDDRPAFAQYLDRRASQDEDLWIIELDIAQGERFIR